MTCLRSSMIDVVISFVSFLHQIFCKIKNNTYICKPKYGPMAEWLRHRSAKPATAVRIRFGPQKTPLQALWRGFAIFRAYFAPILHLLDSEGVIFPYRHTQM